MKQTEIQLTELKEFLNRLKPSDISKYRLDPVEPAFMTVKGDFTSLSDLKELLNMVEGEVFFSNYADVEAYAKIEEVNFYLEEVYLTDEGDIRNNTDNNIDEEELWYKILPPYSVIISFSNHE